MMNGGLENVAICSWYEHTVIYRTTRHDDRRVAETMSSTARPAPGNTCRPRASLRRIRRMMRPCRRPCCHGAGTGLGTV